MVLPVVVCGAGPVGLMLALELAAWQVPVLLVERHRSPSPFPRGRAISTGRWRFCVSSVWSGR